MQTETSVQNDTGLEEYRKEILNKFAPDFVGKIMVLEMEKQVKEIDTENQQKTECRTGDRD